jgi:hypothetical protein
MEAVSGELKSGLPWELLYADDLVLIATSEKELMEKLKKWKEGLENKGMKVNVGKTKWMVSGDQKQVQEPSGRWPCSVCKKGVGRNSLKCHCCQKWVHKKCSGVKGSLQKLTTEFKCSVCNNPPGTQARTETEIHMGDGVKLEKVDKFSYLGDTVCSSGAEAAVVARIRSGWKKFKELAPFLHSKGTSLMVKGRVYDSCVRSSMLYGSETWPLRAEDERKIARNDMSMIRYLCGVKLSDRKSNEELRKSMGIGDRRH